MWGGGLPVQGPVQTYCKGPAPPTLTDMFKLIHFEACNVGKRLVGILLNVFLLSSTNDLVVFSELTSISIHRKEKNIGSKVC